MPAFFAVCSAPATAGQSTATVIKPSACAATAARTWLLSVLGSNLPSTSVIFQPSAFPAATAAAAGMEQPAADALHGSTHTFLPATPLGPEVGSGRSVPAK